ncbi:MAG: M42 family metallopeptidase [Anaerolineae bacterium]|nr:M20/M25/M40 family metallo-hydrolase [Anaerolineales bacterium]MCQ3973109.1 M42 family peptidase [Anaerolineae bacterium]
MTKETNDSSKPTIELLKRLSLAVGVSGYGRENNIHAVVSAELTPYADRVERDRMGSVIGIKYGEQRQSSPQSDDQIVNRQSSIANRKVMLAAHLDEIGAIVTKIDQGFLRFTEIGGLDSRILMGQEVVVHGQRDLPGIIGSIPPHLLPPNQANDKVNMAEMHIDVGLPPRQVERLVQVGDLVSFARTPTELLNGLLSAKAMDNRSSVAAMVICLQELKKLRHQWDVYAVATADEEWGSHVGATTQAYAIHPDVAIVIDVTFADVDEIEVKLNAGPVIALGPSNHAALRKRLIKICQELELKYQSEMMPSGAGTDAYAIEISREGVPTILLSIPSRYMHSPVETVHPKDVERTGRLMAHFIASLDESFVAELTPKT